MEMDVSRFLPDCFHIPVSEQNIASDIRLYVGRAVEINIVSKGLTRTPSVIQEIKTRLIEGSQGMLVQPPLRPVSRFTKCNRFLWVELQIEAIIADCNLDEDIKEVLRSLPSTLAEIYTRCLLRIPKIRPGDLHLAPKILKWVTFANRPLCLDELKEAIAFGPEDSKWNNSMIPNIISSCGNLLIFDDDGTVRLAHSTVRQFLLSDKRPDSKVAGIPLEEQTRILDKFNFQQGQADLEVGEGCVTYLSFSDFDAQLLRTAEPDDFKAKNILPPVANFHALGAPSFNRLLKKAFPRSGQLKRTVIVPRTTTVRPETSSKYKLLNYTKNNWALNTIHISEKSLVWHKFKRLALIQNRSWKLQPWIKGEFSDATYYKSLLQWAIDHEHIPLLSILDSLPPGSKLSDLGKQLLLNGSLPLSHAAGNNRNRSVEFLIRDCKVNVKDNEGETVLHSAARQGHDAVVKVLLTAREIKVN